MANERVLSGLPKPSRARAGDLWVVKVGSSVLTEGGPLLLRSWMQQVATLRKKYRLQIVWVSSGAIATAQKRVNRSWQELSEKQALSAIGQSILMEHYNLALNSIGLMGAQVLLTYDDIRNRTRRHNLKNTLNALLKWKVVPILNENDAVSTEEIQFGDNDSLSAMVAKLMGAKRLIIMSNVDGLYQNDSKQILVPFVRSITPSLLTKIDRAHKSSSGTGGMYSKLLAARNAQKAGIETILMRGDTADGLLKTARGESIGTYIYGR